MDAGSWLLVERWRYINVGLCRRSWSPYLAHGTSRRLNRGGLHDAATETERPNSERRSASVLSCYFERDLGQSDGTFIVFNVVTFEVINCWVLWLLYFNVLTVTAFLTRDFSVDEDYVARQRLMWLNSGLSFRLCKTGKWMALTTIPFFNSLESWFQ